MSAFKSAVNRNNTQTEDNISFTDNGAVALKSSLNNLVDFFFCIGSMRGKEPQNYLPLFESAYQQNSTLALQTVLWLRDVRGGAGERETARQILLHLERNHPEDLMKLLPVLSEFGRWDDLLIFETDKVKEAAYMIIALELRAGNALAAKWMPRLYKLKKNKDGKIVHTSTSNINRKKNNNIARELMKVLNVNDKEYRKLLSSTSSTVEQDMCSNKWDEINYSHVPSVAMNRYTSAFHRHDELRFEEFSNKAAAGEVNINASALFPYDVTTKIYGADGVQQNVLNAQWDSLPDYIGSNKLIPMCDTSASMNTAIPNTSVSAMNMAIALSLYIADKQKSEFSDLFLNFSDDSQIFELKGSNICEKYEDMMKYKSAEFWGGSTDIGKAFDSILNVAVDQQVKPEDMPAFLVILSDMQFNETTWSGVEYYNVGNWSVTAKEYAESKFEQAGYKLPNVVFWNLAGSTEVNPVTFDEAGTAMVSGFSPSILKSILSGTDITPVQIMLETIDSERYKVL